MRIGHVVVLAVALGLTGCTAAPDPQPTPTPTATSASASAERAPTIPIVDGGKQDGASGVAIRDRTGTLWRYLVESGDAALLIIERFDLDLLSQLINSDGMGVRTDTVIYADEILTLVPNSELVGSLRVLDGGPIAGAMGTTTLSADGRPLTYTVVEGDSADLIRKRFDIWWDQLANSDGTRLQKRPVLYVGQVLTFTGSEVAFKKEQP